MSGRIQLVLLMMAAALGTACRKKADCSSVCDCVDEGARNACEVGCGQIAISSPTPASDCRAALESAGYASCESECEDFEPKAPGDQLGQCPGSGAMTVGESFTCDLGGTRLVDYLAFSVGCWDGETGEFLVRFEDGSTEQMDASCSSSESIGGRSTSMVEVVFLSGGGSDGVISFSDHGALGLILGYH